MKCPRLYLCLTHFHFISIFMSIFQFSMQPMHQHNHEWYDPLHIITWPLWSIDLDLAHSSPSSRSIGAMSCQSFTALLSVASKPWLALYHFNWSIKPTLSWSSPPWSHDSMSCLICNELLLVITCGLIICVSPYATLLVHLMLSLNYQNQTRTFHLGLLHIIKGVELG